MADLRVTVKASGGDFTSIIDAWNAGKKNLVTNAQIYTIAIPADSGVTNFPIMNLTSGYTVSALYYPQIVFEGTNRAGLAWSDTKAMFKGANTDWNLKISQERTRIIGAQFNGYFGITIDANNVLLDACYVKGTHNHGIKLCGDAACTGTIIRNSVIDGVVGTDGAGINLTADNAGDLYLENVVIAGCAGPGLLIANWKNATIKNFYSGGNVGANISKGANSGITIVTSATSDGYAGTATVPFTTATFSSVTAGSFNFATATGSGLRTTGTNLSSDATAPFNTDMAGSTRPTVWDIGPGQAAASPTLRTVTYNGNGSTSGTAPSNQTGYAAESIIVSANTGNLALANRELDHWNTAANGSGTNYLIGESLIMPDANVTLYAVWNAFSTIRTRKITWVLDAIYPHGTFVLGDAWVNAPSGLTITSVDPPYATVNRTHQNGTMVNPVCGMDQSYDSRVQELTYTTPPAYPLAVSVNSSVVSTVSASPSVVTPGPSEIMVQAAEVLTVLDSSPSAGSFRPGLIGTTAKTVYNISQIKWNIIPALTATANTPTEQEVASAYTPLLNKPWLVHGYDYNHRYIMPVDNSPAYHQLVQELLTAASLLCLTAFGDRTQLVYGLIQVAIDYYVMQVDGARTSTQGGYNWRWPVIFAGHVLGVDGMRDMWEDKTWTYNSYHGRLIYYKENSVRTIQSTVLTDTTDTWTRYHNATGKKAVFYDVGRLETANSQQHEELAPSEWYDKAKLTYSEGGYKLEAYRDQNSGMVPATSLLARYLGVKDKIAYPEFIAYADRWMYESRAMLQAAGDTLSTDFVKTTMFDFGDELWTAQRNASDTAPAVVNGLAGAVSGSDINLSWTASARARYYQVFRGTTQICQTASLAFTDVGVTSGSYTVRAVNMEDVSSLSSVVAVGGAATYGVTYDGNGNTGGTAPASQTKTQGVSLTLRANTGTLAKTGYTFAGWNTLSNGSGTYYAESASYTTESALSLYAQWTQITYSVTYDGNSNSSGTAPASQTKTYGTSLTLSVNSGSLVKTGFTLSGWNSLANGTGTHYALGASYSTESVLSLYAEWNALTVTLTYNGNGNTGGGVPVDASQYTIGSSATVLGNTGALVRTNFIFGGWNTQANGLGTTYAPGSSIQMLANTALYTRWLDTRFTCVYDANGATEGTVPVDANLYPEGDEVTLVGNTGNLKRTGYVWLGWKLSPSQGTLYIGGDKVLASPGMKLYAYWGSNRGIFAPVSKSVWRQIIWG